MVVLFSLVLSLRHSIAEGVESSVSAYAGYVDVRRTSNEAGRYLLGAPISVVLVFGKSRDSDKQQTDPFPYPLSGIPVAFEVLDAKGKFLFEVDYRVITQDTKVYVPPVDKWFSVTCNFLDSRLRPGRYRLRFKALLGGHLDVVNFDPPEIDIEVVAARSDIERYTIARQRAMYFLLRMELASAEKHLFEMRKLAPGCREPIDGLSKLYAVVDARRALAFRKEYLRLLMRGAVVYPEQEVYLPPTRDVAERHRREFVELALKAGSAASERDARRLLEEFIQGVEIEKDVSILPDGYRKPLFPNFLESSGDTGRENSRRIGLSAAESVQAGDGGQSPIMPAP